MIYRGGTVIAPCWGEMVAGAISWISEHFQDSEICGTFVNFIDRIC